MFGSCVRRASRSGRSRRNSCDRAPGEADTAAGRVDSRRATAVSSRSSSWRSARRLSCNSDAADCSGSADTATVRARRCRCIGGSAKAPSAAGSGSPIDPQSDTSWPGAVRRKRPGPGLARRRRRAPPAAPRPARLPGGGPGGRIGPIPARAAALTTTVAQWALLRPDFRRPGPSGRSSARAPSPLLAPDPRRSLGPGPYGCRRLMARITSGGSPAISPNAAKLLGRGSAESHVGRSQKPGSTVER